MLRPCHVLHTASAGLGGLVEDERATWRVILLTSAAMVVEIAAGWAFGSMALLADGWHMASHAGALGITAFAYAFARRHAQNPRFTFGTGKVGSLGGFASAVVLAVVALLMAWESLVRLVHPVAIGFDQALLVAVLGLGVNLASARMLGGHAHDCDHDHGHCHHHDHNLRAAYLHVVADAMTSVAAIVALLAGKYLGWAFLDPLMGLAGSALIGWWAWGLLRDTGLVLLDHTRDDQLVAEIARRVEAGPGARVADLHLWRVGPRHLLLVMAVEAEQPLEPDQYKALLADMPDLFHVFVEVNARPA